eukprot:634680-Prymnesium_polylepis.1
MAWRHRAYGGAALRAAQGVWASRRARLWRAAQRSLSRTRTCRVLACRSVEALSAMLRRIRCSRSASRKLRFSARPRTYACSTSAAAPSRRSRPSSHAAH